MKINYNDPYSDDPYQTNPIAVAFQKKMKTILKGTTTRNFQ